MRRWQRVFSHLDFANHQLQPSGYGYGGHPDHTFSDSHIVVGGQLYILDHFRLHGQWLHLDFVGRRNLYGQSRSSR